MQLVHLIPLYCCLTQLVFCCIFSQFMHQQQKRTKNRLTIVFMLYSCVFLYLSNKQYTKNGKSCEIAKLTFYRSFCAFCTDKKIFCIQCELFACSVEVHCVLCTKPLCKASQGKGHKCFKHYFKLQQRIINLTVLVDKP